MKLRQMIFLLAAPFCCWGATTDVPARDYKTVNFDNGITSRVLEIGTTSVTFSVTWSIETDIPDGIMFIIGKLDIDDSSWDFLGQVDVIQTQDVAIVEYLYAQFPPLEPESTMFTEKAFFSVQVFVSDEEWEKTWGADGYGTNGVVEPPINAPSAVTAEPVVTAEEKTRTTQGGTPAKVGMANKQDETGEVTTPNQPTSSRWLYLGLLLGAVCLTLYFLRKKKT